MLTKQAVQLNFAGGLDEKTDPFQVPAGKFLSLQNSVFTKGGLLQKRNGFGSLASLPTSDSAFLTTFNGNLTSIGSTLQAYNQGDTSWVSAGKFQPISFSTLAVGRSTFNQTQADAVTAPNGLVCTVYTEVNNGTADARYTVADSITGQTIVTPSPIPVNTGTVQGSPRVFVLGGYFLIVFTNLVSATSHLQYVAVSLNNPAIVTPNQDLASAYTPAPAVSWDGVVLGNKFFYAYNTQAGGQQVEVSWLNTSLIGATPVSFVGQKATDMAICADVPNAIIYIVFYNSSAFTQQVAAVDTNLNKKMNPTQISSVQVDNNTCTAQGGVLTVVYEVDNNYSYDSSVPTHFLNKVTVTLPGFLTTGAVGPTTTIIRSLGLASKAFLMGTTMYVLGAYQSPFQPTYFLLDINGNIISRFAYENGGGYLPTGLPQAQVIGTSVKIAYLFKDLIETQNTLGLMESIGPAGASHVYSQTGVNLATIAFTATTLSANEIGSTLNLSGGFLWTYDGQTLNEQGFHVFPDSIELTSDMAGGGMTPQQYYYQVIYEWTDARGNINRSAPSIPVTITLTSDTEVLVNIPTLRLSYKTGVKITIYRWSTAQQTYYRVTSITAPTLNDPTVDSITYTDTLSDSQILGNEILYTTGGVVEDIAGPAATGTTLFDDRLWLIDAEDPNLLWYSKQVIEATPVEMSDLFTLFIAPSIGSQGSTGDMKCLAPMDDKLIIFKPNAMYYINGSGPDNTGANSQYSQPIFITSAVGSANQRSIVLTPAGLMFQSNKGIWLLDRGLNTSYIGAPVEDFNQSAVNSAVTIPGTNQVRFALDNGTILMYDYYFGQWGTFVGVPAISSTIYKDLHTVINSSGQVQQETPGAYMDRSEPVLLQFTSAWLKLASISGYQRIYEFQLLGQYESPHQLIVQVAYDFGQPTQQNIITPQNTTGLYGSDLLYGQTTPYGGPGSLEQWRVQTARQKCQVVQISVKENLNPAYPTQLGAGFTLSGLLCVLGIKKGYRPIKGAATVG